MATSNDILVCDAATARLYGEIKQSLIRKGRPIPENDIWIAAIARQHGLTLRHPLLPNPGARRRTHHRFRHSGR